MKISLIFTLLLWVSCASSQKVNSSEFLTNSTIKLEVIEKIIDNGIEKRHRSTGTAFFFIFRFPEGEVPVLVTNKHVVKNSELGIISLKYRDSINNFKKKGEKKYEIRGFNRNWLYHPDTAVDLAVFPIAGYIEDLISDGKFPLYSAFEESQIPNDSIREEITAIEDVLMIGYPFGLRDIVNDLPVIRKGITATPPYINYNLRSEFLCDIPVFPGSSGSPIIIYNSESYATRNGQVIFGNRLLLLGVIYATYTRDFQGKIVPKASISIEDSLISQTPIPYNIGIVVQSYRILDFKKLIHQLLKKELFNKRH